MSNPDRLKQLDAHQTIILEIIAAGERLLAAPERDAAALARKRWELARALMAYQGFKHREIFDPLAARGGPDQARAARRLKADCVAMGESFRAYVARWSAVSVCDRWDEYQAAATKLVADLRLHLRRERSETSSLLR